MGASRQDIIAFLAKEWQRCGVTSGSITLVHSRISNTLRRIHSKFGTKPSAEDVVESFVTAAGPDGTLLFPLFNFDFTTGTPFSIRDTPSHMGAISEAARLRLGAIRTGHPIYSFSVFGQNAHLFEGVNNFSGYGDDSPFGILHRNNGRIAVLDLPDQNSMTFYHYVEEQLQVPYRLNKTFTAPYTSLSGETADRSYGLFVRDIDRGVLTDVNRMGEKLWNDGIYIGDKPGEGYGLRSLAATDIYNAVAAVIQAGEAANYLYSVGEMSRPSS